MQQKNRSESDLPEEDQLVDRDRAPADSICVVGIGGIGASAGGPVPLQRLLASLPRDTGFAFVLIQHFAATHHGSLSSNLQRSTAMPVRDVGDGTLVEPNHVYVVPPNSRPTIRNRVLKLGPRQPEGPHLPIDRFLLSLARDCGAMAIGVVLSGAGSEGSTGLRAIREAGGVTFAQEANTAEFPGMPTTAGETAGVDFVLSPERIGVEIGRISRHPLFCEAGHPEPRFFPIEAADQFRGILAVMLEATRIDFSFYREKIIQRRIQRRLALLGIASLEEYAARLRADPVERDALQRDLLICVTSFFREPESFEGLKKLAFPAIVQDRPAAQAIRIWIPGCATGEEAYSIAISLQEYLEETRQRFPVQIFASDISGAAIERARGGRYPNSIETDVSPERLHRFFTKVEGGYQIAKTLRETCVFSRHNLIDDPPFSKLDLISCRNVLIYLGGVQKAIVPRFHYALNERGFLMLGRSETAHFDDMFLLLDRDSRIYRRQRTGKSSFARRARAGALQQDANDIKIVAQPSTGEFRGGVDLRTAVDRLLLSKYARTAVLVDEGLEVLEIRGQATPFLKLPAGTMSFHLSKLLPDAVLFLTVEKLLHESVSTGKAVRRERVAYESDGRLDAVNVDVTPLRTRQGQGHLILFEPVSMLPEPAPESGATPPGAATPIDNGDSRTANLMQELEDARQRLLTLIQDHQAAEDDSQNAAEDALSLNEELQSLNEEIETAKQDLQSTNEELITFNRKLESRNSTLTEARDFAMAIVETVPTPLVVLDGELRIKTVNLPFTSAFQVSRRDAEGLPLYSLSGGRWDIPGLRDRLERVLPARSSFENLEVQWELPSIGTRELLICACRLMGLDMILLTVDDVTVRKQAEQALRRSEEYLRQAQKMEAVGRLAGGIAHDFNNLLTAIMGYLRLISDSLNHGHEAFEYVQEVEIAVNRAATLTERLIAFSQRKALQPKVFDLSLVIEDFGKMMRRLLGEQLTIAVHPGAGLWRVRADPGEIGRVVMNLCLNGRDAMPMGGTLTISTANVSLDLLAAQRHDLAAGRYVRLEVSDTGVGMSAERQAHIFEPFITTKEGGKGTGLGLATVKNIIQESAGAIWCRSELRKGTSFTILLPAVVAAVDEVEGPTRTLSAMPMGSSETILLVDDEELVRKVSRKVLESKGYVVLEADTGIEGLSVCENYRGTIDLLVTDVAMPGMQGPELVERAERIRPDLKILLMSGNSPAGASEAAIQNGPAFLRKPFSPIDLAQKVRAVLDAQSRSGSQPPEPV